jgi:hypothetical protein
MLTGNYEINILLTEHPFPPAVKRPGSDNIDIPVDDPKRKSGAPNFTHHLFFFEKDGEICGYHQTELSKQLMMDLHVNGNVVSWRAFSGSEGVDIWQYTMLINDATDDIAGVCFGEPPLFRGFIAFSGKKLG